ncbi:hypothetical protein [Nitrospirillum sp. BR 11828]|uniref:hypothetical protein n=1 Tax=Nitrospirillum sp. BR 11828 TaxID=3104325 RepID=UPI002ACAF575|nr:hypothetical protein [Nitrospirillum sp. BR 11828]MDZ5650602.1 hypothetical protein [Nitrospirillum sp. BR 11828]
MSQFPTALRQEVRIIIDGILGSPWIAPLFFLMVACLHPDVPGLYMDSVNPDYISVFVTHARGWVPAWIYQDNIFAPGYKYPLLNSLYGGNVTGYIAAVFFSFFGYGVTALRIYHALIGVSLVFVVYSLILFGTGSRGWASIATTVFAIDPAFIFAWRTQYYLQLFPLLAFLPGVLILSRSLNEDRRFGKIFFAGVLIGLSAFFYFIFALYAAVILAVLIYLCRLQRRPVLRPGIWYVVGVVIGYLPYIYAHASIIAQEGMQGWLQNLRSLQNSYGVMNGQKETLLDRVSYTLHVIFHVFGGNPIERLFFAGMPSQNTNTNAILTSKLDYGAWLVVLAWVATIAWVGLGARWRQGIGPLKNSFVLAVMLLAVMVTHVCFGAFMGSPLGYQHYVMLGPIFAIAGIVGVAALATELGPRNPRIRIPFRGLALASLGVIALAHTARDAFLYRQLEVTGGVGVYSDAINRLAAYSFDAPPDTVFAFPQWGYWMGFVVATGGRQEVWANGNVDDLIKRINSAGARQHYMIILQPKVLDSAMAQLREEGHLVDVKSYPIKDRSGEVVVVATLWDPKPD